MSKKCGSCGDRRACERCASLAQRDYAKRAELLLEGAQASVTVFKSGDFRRIASRFCRDGLAKRGIWSVETGEIYGGLHLNVIHDGDLSALRPDYQEIVRSSVAQAVAYITKRGGIPSKEEWAGRTVGFFGKPSEYLAKQGGVIVQAAQAENAMRELYQERVEREREGEDYRAIALRNLPNLRAALKSDQLKRGL